MTTTTTLQVMKGLPYQLRVRAVGKEDYTQNIGYNSDTTVSVNMTAYNGLDMSYEESYQSADKVDFSNTVLPWKWQYSTALTTDRYCLMPTGQNYKNIKQSSTPTLNSELLISGVTVDSNFIASAFTYSGYVMKTVAYSNANTFMIKFHTHVSQTSSGNNSTVVTGSIGVAMTKKVIKFWNNTTSSWQNVFSDLTNDSDFWMKISIIANEVVFSISTDGINYTDYMTGYSAINNVDFSYIGNNPNLTPSWVRNTGSFDLKELKMLDVDGNVIFEGASIPTETLPGCTYNFTDDGSATTLNCFAVNGDEGIVLTPDNSYNIPAQQGGFFGGAIFFSHNPGVTLEMLNVYDSNGNLKWQWDGNYNVVGDLFVHENEEGIVTTLGYENGSYIETQDAFTFEEGDFWEAGAYFLCITTGSQQTVMSSKGFELGVDQNGHPYGTFYGVGTITLTDMTLGIGDEADISCWYSDDNDGYGYKYHLQSTLHSREGHAEDVMLNPTMAESGEKVSFGCFQISDAKEGWLLGTVSIPSHTVYEYDNGTWTEANNA